MIKSEPRETVFSRREAIGEAQESKVDNTAPLSE